jgi:hypothetical protein
MAALGAFGWAAPLAAAPMPAGCHGVHLGRYLVSFHSGPAEPDEPGMAMARPPRRLPMGMVHRHVEVHVLDARTCAPAVRRMPVLTLTSGGRSVREPLARMGLGMDRHFGMDEPLRPGATYQPVVQLGPGVAFFTPFRVPR